MGLKGLGFLIPAAARTLPTGSKYVLPWCFTNDLKKRHAEHLAFALVDTRSQVLVHIVAQQVTVEERAAAVGFHEEFDCRVFLRLAAKNLGDDAFHLAAIATIDQPGTPMRESVARRDQPSELAEATLHEFALADRFAVGHAKFGPGDHAGHHDSHRAGSVGTQRHAARFKP